MRRLALPRENRLFDDLVTTKTFYNWIDDGLVKVGNLDLLLKVRRRHKKPRRERKKVLGKSIDLRPKEVEVREEFGHGEGDGIVGVVTITGYTGSAKELVIPAAINGLPVTAIGGWAFSRCASPMTIMIPSSVTEIGDSAFAGCNLIPATRSEIIRRFGSAPFSEEL